VSAISQELLDGIVERAARPDFDALQAQLRSSGYCARPVRLRGTIETADAHGNKRVWSTETEPDGVLRKACGNRREAVCPPCAERYRGDAYQLIVSGMRGGKGVPETVADHPALFATLTAPSFGPVHTRRLGPDGTPQPCRARRDAPTCPHGRSLSCTARHEEDDPRVGEPLCRDCFDYAGAYAWNYTLGKLWRYTTTYVKRALAHEAGMTEVQLRQAVRPAYSKVVEYQKRGLVHVLARLDRALHKSRADEILPPPPTFSAELFERAFRAAVAAVSAPVDEDIGSGRVRWGEMLDVRQLATGQDRGELAGYLAKYSTKSTELAGGLLHRVEADGVTRAPVREHVRTYMATGFVLDAIATAKHQRSATYAAQPAPDVESDWNAAAIVIRAQRAMGHDERVRLRLSDATEREGLIVRLAAGAPRHGITLVAQLDDGELVHLADVAAIGPAKDRPQRPRPAPRLAACAHAFGYRGHCLTKSRRYSTTFKALREAREAFVHAEILARSQDAAQRALAEAVVRTVALECDGVGHVTAADAYFAASEAARARERRRIGREECCGEPTGARRANRRTIREEPMQDHREAVHHD
jgi:hypothetical protein